MIPGYLIERLLAEGATASVYLATQRSVGRTVALKVLDKLDNAEQSARFLAEGELIAGLSHRNINTLFDVGRVGEQHYLAMEYLEGGSLAERIQRGVRLSAALDIVEAMASCLSFLHERGIIHRDVKPANILFHADGTPKLTDFGIAKQLDNDQQLTLDGTALGSPYYLSPEQATGQAVDGRSDIYSLGVVCFELLTGYKPFSEDSHVQTIVAHINQPVPRLPEHLAAYQPLIDRMMAKESHDRFGSAAELLGFIRGLRLTYPERSPRFWQRPAFALGCVGLMVAGAAAALYFWPRTPLLPQVASPPAAQGAPPVTAAPTPAAPAVPVAAPAPDASIPIITPEQPTAPPAAAPAPDPIADALANAETAFEQNRLTLPKGDNALYYFQQVLDARPGNPVATEGINRIIERYHDMARRALDQREPRRAKRLAERGLGIAPQHAALRAIVAKADSQLADRQRSSSQQQASDTPIRQPIDSIKSWWKRTFD